MERETKKEEKVTIWTADKIPCRSDLGLPSVVLLVSRSALKQQAIFIFISVISSHFFSFS